MHLPHRTLRRRTLLAGLAAPVLAGWATPGVAQPGIHQRLVQLLDTSASQQELSRDYATGLRLAWAGDADKRGRPLLQTVNVGSPSGLRETLAGLAADPSVLGLLGTCGDSLAVQVQTELRRQNLRLAHMAPWMSDSRHDADANLVCLFASRGQQLQQALGAVHGMGWDELCVIYSSSAEHAVYDAQVANIAKGLGLRLTRLTGDRDTPQSAMAARLPASAAMVLCLSTSAELALLTQGMAARKDKRFVVGLGDVDAPSLQQLSPGAGVPVILTQVVPNPHRSPLPLIADYRALLKRLFDETPSPISLAGYIAGLYALSQVRDSGQNPSRESLLAQVGRRSALNLGGWRVEFRDDHRGSRYVTQTLIARDGRLIG